jgi:hypothetical protein
MKKKSSDYLGVAVVISLLLIVLDLIGGFAHLRFESWFKWCSTLILVAGLIIACIQYGKQKTDGLTFGNVFGYGFKIALIISVFMVVYTLISINVIFPEYLGQLLEKSRSDMEAKGGLSEAQIDQGIAITKKFMQPVPLSIFTFVVLLFIGTIGSLLGAAFTKKSEPVPKIFQDNP